LGSKEKTMKRKAQSNAWRKKKDRSVRGTGGLTKKNNRIRLGTSPTKQTKPITKGSLCKKTGLGELLPFTGGAKDLETGANQKGKKGIEKGWGQTQPVF